MEKVQAPSWRGAQARGRNTMLSGAQSTFSIIEMPFLDHTVKLMG